MQYDAWSHFALAREAAQKYLVAGHRMLTSTKQCIGQVYLHCNYYWENQCRIEDSIQLCQSCFKEIYICWA